MSSDPNPLLLPDQPDRPWWWDWQALLVSLLVVGIYSIRLTHAPVCGEESRWATMAREMIASGDWIVPRQQGTIFPERPPLGSWAIALVGMARGQVDLVAIRLPSVVATLLLSLLIYAYARTWMAKRAALAAAVIYPTFGQVLALGRFGESEALFTLFVAGSLLAWHAGYVRGWSRTRTWVVGYSLAALGSLVKGPQAPVYFVLVCCAFLLIQRNWRWLFCWGHGLGIAAFAAIVGSWMIPFCLTDWYALDDIWAGLASARYTTQGLAKHLVSFPWETLGCLLPWSPLLAWYLRPAARRAIFSARPQAWFLVLAIALTYPSVWLAAHSRGRYFMPLYPCVAVLIALVIEHCTHRWADLADQLFWRRYVRALSAAVVVSGLVVVVLQFVPIAALAHVRFGWWMLASWCLAGAATAGLACWEVRGTRIGRVEPVVLCAAAFVGVTYVGLVLGARRDAGNDLEPTLAEIKRQMAEPESLVSFNRVYHRFAYSYGEPIGQMSWPQDGRELPDGIEYFCYDRREGYYDPPIVGRDGQAQHAGTTAPLPFEWDLVAEMPSDPVRRPLHNNTVIIGRIRRTARVAEQASPPAPR